MAMVVKCSGRILAISDRWNLLITARALRLPARSRQGAIRRTRRRRLDRTAPELADLRPDRHRQKLACLCAPADYERRSRDQATTLDADARRRILDLAEQLPRIWQDPRVDSRDRKRILRLLIDDVTLIKSQTITVHVRLSGGATRILVLDRPLPIAQIRKFKPELVAEVDRLLDHHCDREIANILNERGSRTWEGKPFNLKKIAFIRAAYKLASRHERLRRRGMLTTRELVAKFGVAGTTIHDWGRQGLIKKCYTDSRNRGLWEIPSGQTILKGYGGRHPRLAKLIPVTAQSPE